MKRPSSGERGLFVIRYSSTFLLSNDDVQATHWVQVGLGWPGVGSLALSIKHRLTDVTSPYTAVECQAMPREAYLTKSKPFGGVTLTYTQQAYRFARCYN
jgi:hypothetical protein